LNHSDAIPANTATTLLGGR